VKKDRLFGDLETHVHETEQRFNVSVNREKTPGIFRMDLKRADKQTG
jgi:hypothetical protein